MPLGWELGPIWKLITESRASVTRDEQTSAHIQIVASFLTSALRVSSKNGKILEGQFAFLWECFWNTILELELEPGFNDEIFHDRLLHLEAALKWFQQVIPVFISGGRSKRTIVNTKLYRRKHVGYWVPWSWSKARNIIRMLGEQNSDISGIGGKQEDKSTNVLAWWSNWTKRV